MKNATPIFWSLIALVVAMLSLLAWSLPTNEYRVIGIPGALDCDGPLSVLVFAVPAFIVAALALFFFLRQARLRTAFGSFLFAVLLLSSAASAIAVLGAVQEHMSLNHREGCGPGL